MWQPQGFYNQYVLRSPVILSGKESVLGLYNYPASRIAIIHGKTFFDYKLFESAFSKKDIRFIERSWKNEPDLEGIKGTVRELEEFRADTIIAIGGGSVIDGSKLCRLLYEFPYFVPGQTRLTGELFKTRFVAIPTTIGSGAEVSSSAVYIDHKTHKKDMVVIHELQPEVIVYDKRYVENTPDRVLVSSAVDGMSHIIEGYVSRNDNSFVDILAESGLSLFATELRKFFGENREEVNYERLQYAGYMGGVVQNHCVVGATHAFAHQLSDFGFAHGEAVALLLPQIMVLNSKNEKTFYKYEVLAKKTDFSSVEELELFINMLCEKSGISKRKGELVELLKTLSKEVVFRENVKSDKGGNGNPIEISDNYIDRLVESI